MQKISWKTVLIIALIMAVVAFTGSSFTHINGWYYNLHKPAFQPPNWLFAPVWTLLYILIGIAAYLIYISHKEGSRFLLILFSLNLIINVCWSYLFFTQHNLLLAMVDLILLWITIVIMMIKARTIHRSSAWFLLPYFLWVSFAGLLNYSVLILNG